MKNNAKSAFTMIEMLVVIGIIGILASVLLATFGGASDSARASQCEANMRNLATACTTYAMQEANGFFPAAGSFQYLHPDTKSFKKKDWERMRIGWISGTEQPGDRAPGGIIPFNSQSEDMLRHALTNGAGGVIWKIVEGSRKTYQCPIHAEACRKANGRLPGWSYVMNKEFGYDKSDSNSKTSTFQGLRIASKLDIGGKSRDPSRVLMFAELQGADIDDTVNGVKIHAELNASGTKADGVLDYDNESIGFNHKIGRGRYAAHVAFTDGHVERLHNPISGISRLKLTEALCKGHEIRFNGKAYEDLQTE